MITLADHSDIATWGWKGWLVLAAIALIAYGFHAISNATERKSEPSTWDRRDGKGDAGR